MAPHSPPILLIFLLLLLLHHHFAAGDDGAVMSSLANSLIPTPPGWKPTTAYCQWTGVSCDNSNRVTTINLPSLSLSGSLPASLSQLSQLKTLGLQSNSILGPLPSFANSSSLQNILLDGNNFTSLPQDFFVGLTNLQTLSISDNPHISAWQIPQDLTQSVNLKAFYASNANINGSIPDMFGSFPNLQDLRLSYNNLTGSLPSSLGGSGIQSLWLNNQAMGLSGGIDVLGSMTQITQAWLQANAFTGPIPDLTNCTNLFDLQLRDNLFTGVLPPSLMSLPKLANITLQNNKFQGPYPSFGPSVTVNLGASNGFCNNVSSPCDPQVTTLLEVAGALGYPMLLAESWTGNDACKGWNLVTCDSSGKNVATVSFGKQHFSGTISPAFGNLTSLRSLLLNDNNLTGSIPTTLLNLTSLQFLDVSNNNLSGPIPTFPSTVKFTYTGNLLLGRDVSGGGNGSGSSGSSSPGGSPGSSKGSSVSTGLIVGVVVAAVVFLVVLFFVSYKCYVKKKRHRFGRVENPDAEKGVVKTNAIGVTSKPNVQGYGGVASELQSQSSGDYGEIPPLLEGGNVVISIQVLRQVTNNFSDDNVLGRGGFGVVYKGELQDGTTIAVKRMESAGAMGSKGLNEFQAEISVLTKVRHRHLVALLGYCINENERLLVYEYMPQGTLSQHLFDLEENGYPPLSWKQRVSIALDVARGVEYLHSLAQQSFIHRDLKTSNILLGDDMRAKVSDFGLVKNAPDGGKYSVETRVAGTFGYLAPEYAATGRVTTKVDVYAFGVVLMELITGRRALDSSMPDENSHLVTWFRRVLVSKDILKAIDQTLNPDEETLESIYKVAELAGYCTVREPSQRPDMGHAVNVLGPLVEQWKPSNSEEEEDTQGNTSLSLILQRWQADEGTSTMFDTSFDQTQVSIPAVPSTIQENFNSAR